jgi:hypothetical protein
MIWPSQHVHITTLSVEQLNPLLLATELPMTTAFYS